MNADIKEIIADLKSHLQYLKEMGIETQRIRETDPSASRSASSASRRPVQRLEEIRKEMGDCRRCKLHRTRRTLVFGEGNPEAGLMFVGEGPGYDEDVQGRPFVGRAGQLLTKIIESIQLRREDVYIANIIKCRPPQNRNPEPDEIEACHPFLMMQIEAIRPKIICALGTFAGQTLLKTDAKITALRGKLYEREGIRILPTYHPAYLLRNPERKREVWEDIKRISQWMTEEGTQPAGSKSR